MKETILILFLLYFPLFLRAQNSLIVNEKNGTITSIPINDIKKLTFNGEKIVINENDGTINTLTLSDIRSINFDENTNISQDKIILNEYLKLFPNPVTEELTVNFQSSENGTVFIDFIDMQGKVVSTKNEQQKEGTNQIQISLLNLSKGLYICRLNNGRAIKTIKFIKN